MPSAFRSNLQVPGISRRLVHLGSLEAPSFAVTVPLLDTRVLAPGFNQARAPMSPDTCLLPLASETGFSGCDATFSFCFGSKPSV